MFDIGCFSHTLDHIGEKLKTIISAWINLFSRSRKNKLAWKSLTGIALRTYSETWWWFRWEVMKRAHDRFRDVGRFVQTADLSPAAKVKLQQIFNNRSTKSQPMVELAITVDVPAHGRVCYNC